MNIHTQHSRDHGFTLLELVMVLGIILVIGAIGAPRFASANARYRVEFAARRVAADLSLAQNAARTQAQETKVSFTPLTDQYHISGIDALDDSGDYYVSMNTPPYHATIVSVNFEGNALVTFNGWGIPDANGVITLQVGSEQRIVTLSSPTGEVSIQ